MSPIESPFIATTKLPLVAIVGARAGYMQIAPSQITDDHGAVPEQLFIAGQHWASFLQTQENVAKIYWLEFSEVVAHLHWHLYPRFSDDILKGPDAFNARNHAEHQPEWPLHWQAAVYQWAERFHVELLDPEHRLLEKASLVTEYI